MLCDQNGFSRRNSRCSRDRSIQELDETRGAATQAQNATAFRLASGWSSVSGRSRSGIAGRLVHRTICGGIVGGLRCIGGGSSCGVVRQGNDQPSILGECGCGCFWFPVVGDRQNWTDLGHVVVGAKGGLASQLACHVGGLGFNNEGLLGGSGRALGVLPKSQFQYKAKECQLKLLPPQVLILVTI